MSASHFVADMVSISRMHFPESSRRSFIAGLTLASLTSCGRKTEPGPADSVRRVALLIDSRSTPLRNMQALLLERLARQRAGMQLTIWDALGDASVQGTQLTEAAATKPEFILVFPIDAKAITPGLRSLKEAGIKIIVLGADLDESACSTAVFCDEKSVGQTAAEFIISALHQKAVDEGSSGTMGRILLLQSEKQDQSEKRRRQGLDETLKKEPGIIIVHEAPCSVTGEDVAPRVAEALRIQHDFDVILAHNDLAARAAAKAISAQKPGMRDRVLVIGIDGVPGKNGGVQMVIDAEIDATVRQPPLVDSAWALILRSIKEPGFHFDRRYDLKPRVINYEAAVRSAGGSTASPQEK